MPKTTICKSNNFREAEKFLNNCFSSPTHWPDWNLVVSKHYKSDFYYYFARKGDELIGICPVHEEKEGILRNLYSGQYHYIPYGGWIFKNEFEFCKFPLRFNQLFSGFNLPVNNNVKFKEEYNKFLTLIIDLQTSEEEIWKDCINSKRRNMVRKAEKSGINVNVTNEYNEDFYHVYNKSCNRNGLIPLSQIFFIDLLNSVNIDFRIFTALKDNEILANIVVVHDKNYSIYWLGNNVDNVPNLGQGEILQWHAIQYLQSVGCKYYDLCYIEPARLPHIYEFKRGFSKNEVEIPYISQRHLAYKIIDKVKGCF